MNASDNFLIRQTFKPRPSAHSTPPRETFMCLRQSLWLRPDYLCGRCNDMRIECRYGPEAKRRPQPGRGAASEVDDSLDRWFGALGHVCLSSANAHCDAPVSGAPIPSDLVESQVLGCFYASRLASSAQRLGLITHKPFNLYCKHSKDAFFFSPQTNAHAWAPGSDR